MSQQRSRLPGFFGSLVLGPTTIGRIFRRPSILALVYGAFFFLSLFQVFPAWQVLHANLDVTPLSDGRGGRLLLEELVRIHPDADPSIVFTGIISLVLMMFFAGGAVMMGTEDPAGRKISSFLCSAGTNFFRSFRTFLVFLVLLIFWTFLLGRVVTWLPPAFSRGGNETALFRRELGLSVFWFLGFFLLLYLRRLALARIVLTDKRSAILAYFSSIWFLLRHPLVLFLSCFGLCLVGTIVLLGGAFLVQRFEAAEASALPIFVTGQMVFLTLQASLLGSFALAARLWELDRGFPPQEETSSSPQSSVSPHS